MNFVQTLKMRNIYFSIIRKTLCQKIYLEISLFFWPHWHLFFFHFLLKHKLNLVSFKCVIMVVCDALNVSPHMFNCPDWQLFSASSVINRDLCLPSHKIQTANHLSCSKPRQQHGRHVTLHCLDKHAKKCQEMSPHPQPSGTTRIQIKFTERGQES